MDLSRFLRTSLRSLVLVVLATQVSAQSVLTVALADLSRYFGAAARLVAGAITGLDQVETTAVPPDQRKNALAELRDLSRSISRLRAPQRLLIEDLAEYVTTVRKRGFASQEDIRSWKIIIGSVRSVSEIVRDTLAMVEGSAWLRVALTVEDRNALEEVLRGRVSLLSRWQTLPAPSELPHVEQLERMNQHYRKLFDSLSALHAALTRAADRLEVK